jgi:hypothetical protein
VFAVVVLPPALLGSVLVGDVSAGAGVGEEVLGDEEETVRVLVFLAGRPTSSAGGVGEEAGELDSLLVEAGCASASTGVGGASSDFTSNAGGGVSGAVGLTRAGTVRSSRNSSRNAQGLLWDWERRGVDQLGMWHLVGRRSRRWVSLTLASRAPPVKPLPGKALAASHKARPSLNANGKTPAGRARIPAFFFAAAHIRSSPESARGRRRFLR